MHANSDLADLRDRAKGLRTTRLRSDDMGPADRHHEYLPVHGCVASRHLRLNGFLRDSKVSPAQSCGALSIKDRQRPPCEVTPPGDEWSYGAGGRLVRQPLATEVSTWPGRTAIVLAASCQSRIKAMRERCCMTPRIRMRGSLRSGRCGRPGVRRTSSSS